MHCAGLTSVNRRRPLLRNRVCGAGPDRGKVAVLIRDERKYWMTEPDNALVAELERRLAARGWPHAPARRTEVERFLTPAEAAKVLRCSPGLLYSLLRAGDIPAIRMGAKRYAIPVRAVNLIVDVIMAAGSCIGLADWKAAWDAYVADNLTNGPRPGDYRALDRQDGGGES